MVGMCSAVCMADKVINLESSGTPVCPVVLLGLPPGAQRTERCVSENHDKKGNASKKYPTDTAFLWRRFAVNNNVAVALGVDFLTWLNVSPGAGRRALRVNIILIFLVIV